MLTWFYPAGLSRSIITTGSAVLNEPMAGAFLPLNTKRFLYCIRAVKVDYGAEAPGADIVPQVPYSPGAVHRIASTLNTGPGALLLKNPEGLRTRSSCWYRPR